MKKHEGLGVQGFLLLYSITSRSSFEEVKGLREQIIQSRGKDIPVVLVGHQLDLEDKRQVATAEGKELAKTLGCSFFEASAKCRINVEEAFFQLVREVKQPLGPKQKGMMATLKGLLKRS